MQPRARVIPRGRYPDSARDSVAYWSARPTGDRIAAVEGLRRETYRLFHGRALPRLKKVARILRRAR